MSAPFVTGVSTSLFGGMDLDGSPNTSMATTDAHIDKGPGGPGGPSGNGGSGGSGDDWTAHDDSIFPSPPRKQPPSRRQRQHALTSNSTPSPNRSGGPLVVSPSGATPAAARAALGSPAAPVAAPPAPARVSVSTMPSTSTSLAVATVSVATAASTAVASGTSSRSKELLNGPLMFRTPLSVAIIAVHGREFFVHTELLCKHSDYFAQCLRGGFAEAATQRIELGDDDVSVEDVGLWVDLLYRWHFHQPDAEAFVLRKEQTGGTLSTMQLLTLWKLSDRFLHKPLAALADESLQHRLGLYSAEQWRKLYRTRPAADIRARVSRLQDAYRYCTEHALPFGDAVVAACANCPAQVYDDCVSLLDPDFMGKVSRTMIMAHADSSLLSREQRTASLTQAQQAQAAGACVGIGAGASIAATAPNAGSNAFLRRASGPGMFATGSMGLNGH